jgi:hypothetical protein
MVGGFDVITGLGLVAVFDGIDIVVFINNFVGFSITSNGVLLLLSLK